VTRTRCVAASGGVRGRDRRWNHNTHYYPLVLAAVPAGCQRVLDVGCGEGMLARSLAHRIPHVAGVDRDAASIELGRRQDADGKVEFVRGDLLACPFQPASFGMVTCVAALHHMDPAAALAAMNRLLAPGGTLVVIGLALRYRRHLLWRCSLVWAKPAS
jgi:ubiquinone/menaquinone biosynthesis C-methylase UbiE